MPEGHLYQGPACGSPCKCCTHFLPFPQTPSNYLSLVKYSSNSIETTEVTKTFLVREVAEVTEEGYQRGTRRESVCSDEQPLPTWLKNLNYNVVTRTPSQLAPLLGANWDQRNLTSCHLYLVLCTRKSNMKPYSWSSLPGMTYPGSSYLSLVQQLPPLRSTRPRIRKPTETYT